MKMNETTYHFFVEERFVETIWSVKAANEEEAQEKLFDRASDMPELMSGGDITLHSRQIDGTEVEPVAGLTPHGFKDATIKGKPARRGGEKS